MTDEDKFWFVVRELGDCAKTVPLPVLRAIQLIYSDELDLLRVKCERLEQRVSDLEARISEAGKLRPLQRNRREEMLITLKACNGDLKQAAMSLGVNRSTIYRHIPKLRHILNETISFGHEKKE